MIRLFADDADRADLDLPDGDLRTGARRSGQASGLARCQSRSVRRLVDANDL